MYWVGPLSVLGWKHTPSPCIKLNVLGGIIVSWVENTLQARTECIGWDHQILDWKYTPNPYKVKCFWVGQFYLGLKKYMPSLSWVAPSILDWKYTHQACISECTGRDFVKQGPNSNTPQLFHKPVPHNTEMHSTLNTTNITCKQIQTPVGTTPVKESIKG